MNANELWKILVPIPFEMSSDSFRTTLLKITKSIGIRTLICTLNADSSHLQKIQFRAANTLFCLMGYVVGAVFKSSWLRIDAIAAPILKAFWPWQNPCKRCKKVENRQRNERRIVGDHRNGGNDLTDANTTKGWIHSPNFDGTFARELP